MFCYSQGKGKFLFKFLEIPFLLAKLQIYFQVNLLLLWTLFVQIQLCFYL